MTLKQLNFAGGQSQREASLKDRLTQMAIWLVNEPERTLTALHRGREIERLNAMTDAQLASLGMTRDQIVARVFRDMSES